jgi:hypothetical protein
MLRGTVVTGKHNVEGTTRGLFRLSSPARIPDDHVAGSPDVSRRASIKDAFARPMEIPATFEGPDLARRQVATPARDQSDDRRLSERNPLQYSG